jgi:hypothetical protein
MFVILVTETGSDVEAELCRVATNPGPIAAAAERKTNGKRKIPRYQSVRVIEVETQS